MKITTTSKEQYTYPKDWLRVELTKGKKIHLLKEEDLFTLTIGVGDGDKISTRELRILVRKIVEEIKKTEFTKVVLPSLATFLGYTTEKLESDYLGELIATNILLANYTFRIYKTAPKKGWRDITDVVCTETTDKLFVRGLERGAIIGAAISETRDLANTPGGDMTPQILGKAAQTILKGTKVQTTVLGKKEIEKLKMGALLGVSKGSSEDPRFIVMEYWGGKNKSEKPIVFVGKGITFDTGGLNIKPTDGILDMHLDMSGGASVIGALKAIAKLGIKRNVIGLIPSAENMVSGSSYRPGDVLTTMSGKTVDVLNTDAEGRLVLADGLTYAERYKPALVVDIATLTGAALVALGQHASAVMSKDEQIAFKLKDLGEESGDYLWPLPLWDEYLKYTKGVHGDLANIPQSNGRYGGAINGGAFLSNFSGSFPWAHIDTAPRMTSTAGDYLAKGATGEPVRLLIAIAEKYS